MSLSLIAVPVFLKTSTRAEQLLTAWTTMYSYGFPVLPTCSIGTFGLYALAALGRRAAGETWRDFVVAAAVTVGMIPFTWIVLWPTNGRLEGLYERCKVNGGEKDRGGGEVKIEEVRGLVEGWRLRHLVRSLFPLTGALIGVGGLLRERS